MSCNGESRARLVTLLKNKIFNGILPLSVHTSCSGIRIGIVVHLQLGVWFKCFTELEFRELKGSGLHAFLIDPACL